jgi:hypothetical protein
MTSADKKIVVLDQVMVAYTYNPSYAGGRRAQEDHGSKPDLGK